MLVIKFINCTALKKLVGGYELRSGNAEGIRLITTNQTQNLFL